MEKMTILLIKEKKSKREKAELVKHTNNLVNSVINLY